jgi:probable phosphoglycerate mutase
VSGTRLVIVRHGVTDWNREGRFQGHLDPPLSDVGRREAELVATRLASDDLLRPARIVSSSLARAMETATSIGNASDVAVEHDDRLMEIGQGEWEGRTHAELEVADARRYRAWRDAAGVRQPPGGEPIESAMARVRAVLDALQTSEAATVCLVSHGGTIRVLARLLFDLADDRSWALDVDNASVGAATLVDGGWRLDRWNDTRHLLGRELTHVDESEGRPLAL